ncbi:ABC transporter substrate-binding protein [Paenibacillus sp. GCM10027626]|uniref:ABC transporter substrate-binding protein n=1 Tax=Paenibacillus sp. GCM10027626 TaxID=3273411 RepID=UPI00363E092A
MKRLKSAAVLSALAATSIFASACSGGNSDAMKEEKATVKVLYWDEQVFMMEYGNLFNARYPNIEVEVIGQHVLEEYKQRLGPEEAWNSFLQNEAPDVVALDHTQYKQLAANNQLMDLEPMLQEKDFKGEDIFPGFIDKLKEQGGGKLYGLTPTFISQAIFYNADLFSKYGIEIPAKGMSWKEILELAKRFPNKENEAYGLNYMDFYHMGLTIGWSEGLTANDADVTKITLQSEGWKKAFETAIAAKDVIAPSEEQGNNGYLSNDPFINGKAAMTVNSPYYMDQIEQNAEQLNKDINWGLVPGPADPNDASSGGVFIASDVFAIRANSPNAKAAWELVKYINSDEAAKFLSRTFHANLLARTKHIKERPGKNIEAFYALNPIQDVKGRFFSAVPYEFIMAFNKLVDEEIQATEEGKKSLDDALQTIETKASQELVKAREQKETN